MAYNASNFPNYYWFYSFSCIQIYIVFCLLCARGSDVGGGGWKSILVNWKAVWDCNEVKLGLISSKMLIGLYLQVNKGSKSPYFNLRDQNGKNVSLSNFKGKPVVVYFYPADETPGCTKQAYLL